MSDIDDLFADNTFLTTPAVARFAGLSEAQTRALASDIGVAKAGAAFAWSADDVQALVDQLDTDDDDTDDDDPSSDDDDEDPDDSGSDDDDADDSDDTDDADADEDDEDEGE
jgi:hypothetical protein